MNKSPDPHGHYKYEGSYENIGLLYDHPTAATSPMLAPLYDVVTTTIYACRDYHNERTLVDRTLALKLDKSRHYPTRQQLLKFGVDHCHVLRPEAVIERIATAMSETLEAHQGRFEAEFLSRIRREWDAGRQAVERGS